MKKIKDKINTFFKTLRDKCPIKCERLKSWISKNKIFSVGLLIVAVAFSTGYFFKGVFIAATVNGRPITRIRVIRDLEKYYGTSALDSIITQEIIKQKAKSNGIKISKSDIETEIKNIEENVKSQGRNLDDILVEQGMTKKDLYDNLELQKTVEKVLADKITVTDEEVQKYIEDNSQSFPEGTNMEEVKTLIKQQLVQEKMGLEYQNWLEEIKKDAKINIVAKYQ